MWFGLEIVVNVVVSCTSVGLRWGDFRVAVAGLSIVEVISGVVWCAFILCVLGAALMVIGGVGCVVIVTGGATLTLCPWSLWHTL